MILKELVNSTNIQNITNIISTVFPSEKDFLVNYEWMFIKLKMTKATDIKNNIMIVVYPALDIFNQTKNQIHNDVCGYNATEKTAYDIKLCSYAECLGMEISQQSLDYYGRETVLAYVLRDMAFHGVEDIYARDFVIDSDELIVQTDKTSNMPDENITKKVDKIQAKIEEIMQKNKKSFCEMLGIENIDSVQYFMHDNAFMV